MAEHVSLNVLTDLFVQRMSLTFCILVIKLKLSDDN